MPSLSPAELAARDQRDARHRDTNPLDAAHGILVGLILSILPVVLIVATVLVWSAA